MNSPRASKHDIPGIFLRDSITRVLALAFFALALFAAAPGRLQAQGCILARSPEQTSLPGNKGGLLLPGHFQVTLGERHQFSTDHYVGDVYQEYRKEEHNRVQNRINLLDVNLTYQWTPRISVEVDTPILFASRKAENSTIEYQASGLGDMIIAVNSWLRNPTSGPRNNFSIGLGVLMPTGNDDVTNTILTTDSNGNPIKVTTPVDFSIQPGGGGWGLVMQWQGYQRINNSLTFYTDGDYMATQGGTDGVPRNYKYLTAPPLEQYNAIVDQYLFEAGVQFPVHIAKVQGLYATIGPRDEGVPADNLFPSSNAGWQRPGYAVSAGPGFEYARGSNLITGNIYKAIHRDRTSSYPDQVYGTHGDAAFANWVWLASVTHRF
ncbi:MAG TPA: hypothetical protein VFU55_00500 [Terracidiphilus sp.]|nr:hypothetical protein [Terracidiphilus sp.]